MSRNIPTICVALLVILVIGCMMCAFQVRFVETAVVTRFDRIIDEFGPEEAGLHFKLPWPIDRVHRYDTRLRSFETEFRQAATKDQKTVILTAYATWRITDGKKFLKAVGREEAAATKIRDLLENQVQLVLRDHNLEELVNIDPTKLKLDRMEHVILTGDTGAAPAGDPAGSTRRGIQRPAMDQYGIEIVSVGIKRLGLPETVTKDVFVRMKEDRQKAIKQLDAEGKAEATKFTVGAEEVSRKIIARAQAYAKALVGQGDAEAAKYYKIFAENRQLSDFLKKLETVERILESGQITLVFDSGKIPPFDVLANTDRPATPPDTAAEADGGVDEPVTKRPVAEGSGE